jgi:hypothetical protein
MEATIIQIPSKGGSGCLLQILVLNEMSDIFLT